jgi:hypothetical protein
MHPTAELVLVAGYSIVASTARGRGGGAPRLEGVLPGTGEGSAHSASHMMPSSGGSLAVGEEVGEAVRYA